MGAVEPVEAGFQPRFAGYAARVRDSFARQGLMAHLGAELTVVEPGHVEIELPYAETLSQQHGFFHGGATAAIADSAAGYAAFTLMPEDASVLTIEFKINLLAPAQGDRLIARGRVKRAGRVLSVCTADVSVRRDGDERLCASLLTTMMAMHGRSDYA
jgi:uncharacterized protein (TIGR00369 family)